MRPGGAHRTQRGFLRLSQRSKGHFGRGKGLQQDRFLQGVPDEGEPRYFHPDIFTEIREWKHAQMKRFAVTPYSLASIQRQAPYIESVERQLIEKLDGFAGDSGEPCDLGDWLHYFAFDVGLSRNMRRGIHRSL
jgi:hypothetical protein